MLSGNIAGLTTEGLAKYSEYLQKEIGRASFWRGLATKPEGQFLLEELRTRREFVRNLYSAIPPSGEGTREMLSGLQATEWELCQLIQKIEKHDDSMVIAETELRNIRNEIERRRDRESARGGFLPAASKEKEKVS